MILGRVGLVLGTGWQIALCENHIMWQSTQHHHYPSDDATTSLRYRTAAGEVLGVGGLIPFASFITHSKFSVPCSPIIREMR